MSQASHPFDPRSFTEGLYQSSQEHDACGVGFVAHIKGAKTHAIVSQALKILENLDHRGAVGADKLMGDGAGILIQLPDALYREDMDRAAAELQLSHVLVIVTDMISDTDVLDFDGLDYLEGELRRLHPEAEEIRFIAPGRK